MVRDDDRTDTASAEAGATSLEYGLMISLIALVAVGALGGFGEGILGLFVDALAEIP